MPAALRPRRDVGPASQQPSFPSQPLTRPSSGAAFALPQVTAQIILVEAPSKDVPIKCLVGTWNVGNEPPPSEVKAWLKTSEGSHELVAIGAQECTYKERSGFKDCEVGAFQPTPSPSRPHTPLPSPAAAATGAALFLRAAGEDLGRETNTPAPPEPQ